MTLSALILAASLIAGESQTPPAPAADAPALPHRQDPFAVDRDSDPILNITSASTSLPEFIALLRPAVERHPGFSESRAGIAEAEAAEDEADAALFPTADLTIQATRSLSRRFGSDPEDIVERSRALGRSDALITVEQTVFDFGASSRRIEAAGARLRAAGARAQSVTDQVTLSAVIAWYDVFAYRALVMLGSAYLDNQRELRRGMETRIVQGLSAPGDLPRVDSYIASAEADTARYRRQLANAEARFEEAFGTPAPVPLVRAPVIDAPAITREMAQFLARSSPDVQQAEALARAERQEARAAKAAALPRLSAGVDGGKYGFNDNDYDVRGRITLRQRFSGAVIAQVDRANARALSAEARADRVRDEAEREASIAWSDVEALEVQLAALESSYVASKQSRDILAERFLMARGTLFDVLESQSNYFNVAASYVQAVIELDSARYMLLSRTGQLLPALGIQPPSVGGNAD